jgi:hypothetical protein
MRILTLSQRAKLVRTKENTYIVEKVDGAFLKQIIKVDSNHCKTIGMAQTICGALQVIVDYETGLEELVPC